MTEKISLLVKKILIKKIKDKYKKAKKKDKSFIIDDVVEITNYKRKYGYLPTLVQKATCEIFVMSLFGGLGGNCFVQF